MSLIDISLLQKAFPNLMCIQPYSQIGGQKYIFTATDTTRGEIILKVLKNVYSSPRLLREIQVVQILGSTHVPKLYDFGKQQLGGKDEFYIIEEKINGENLVQIRLKGAKLTEIEIISCLEMLLHVCVEMEKRGIVHRDIKPSNIIKDINGKFWLIDFGISRHLQLESITKTNQNFGPHTPGYSAPEQFRNMKRDIDSRTDLFSIGVTIFELLSGTNPFVQGAHNELEVLRNTETISLPLLTIKGDTQKQLSAFINILTDKHISRRPRNAQEAYDWYIALKPTLQL